MVHVKKLLGKTLVGAAHSLGLYISDQWKQQKIHYRTYRQHIALGIKLLSKISLIMNYNTEIPSSVNANKNRTE